MYKGIMLTKKDIDNLKESFVTKEEFSDLKNTMITGFDKIMHEIRSMREELTVMFYRQSENSEKIETNSKRISNLEDKLSF